MKRIVILSFLLALLIGCAEAQSITRVKNSTLGACPLKSVGELVDKFFGSPSWDNQPYLRDELVTLKGSVRYGNRSAKVELRFVLGQEKNIGVNSMTIDGVIQTRDKIDELLNMMCAASSRR